MLSANCQQGISLNRKCHFEKGRRNEVAVVLSCPGSREERSNRPASGITGKNLELLLGKLRPVLGYQTLERDDITVTNAHAGIEYQGLTGRSEANSEEILQMENIHRLNAELACISDFVIFCGVRASWIAESITLRQGVKVICLPHLGMQSINQIKQDKDGVPILSVAESRANGNKRSKKEIGRENTLRRIEVLAELAKHQVSLACR